MLKKIVLLSVFCLFSLCAFSQQDVGVKMGSDEKFIEFIQITKKYISDGILDKGSLYEDSRANELIAYLEENYIFSVSEPESFAQGIFLGINNDNNETVQGKENVVDCLRKALTTSIAISVIHRATGPSYYSVAEKDCLKNHKK